MRIAILGYGSLIWDLDTLSPHVQGRWHMGAGPRLPVEFARISPKRKRALALVIHQPVPAPSATCYILSSRKNLAAARTDLALRERTDEAHIGWARADGSSAGHSGLCEDAVTDWLKTRDHIDAAIWTDLDSNFEAELAKPFSHVAARDYLQSLPPASLEQAWRYITFAPSQTDTPFRRYLAQDPWWRGVHDSHAKDPQEQPEQSLS